MAIRFNIVTLRPPPAKNSTRSATSRAKFISWIAISMPMSRLASIRSTRGSVTGRKVSHAEKPGGNACAEIRLVTHKPPRIRILYSLQIAVIHYLLLISPFMKAALTTA